MPDLPLSGVYGGSLPHSHVDNGACVLERFLSSPDLCTSHGRPHPCSEPPRGSPGWPGCPRTPLARAAQSPWAPLPSGGPQPLPRPSPSSSFQSRRNAASWRRLPTEDGTPPLFCPLTGGPPVPGMVLPQPYTPLITKTVHRYGSRGCLVPPRRWPGAEVSAYSQRVLGRLPPLPVRAE